MFLLQHVIHNFGTSYAIKILRHLREAAVVGKTKLLVVAQVVQHACREQAITGDIKMPDLPVAPEPMLPNVRIHCYSPTVNTDLKTVVWDGGWSPIPT